MRGVLGKGAMLLLAAGGLWMSAAGSLHADPTRPLPGTTPVRHEEPLSVATAIARLAAAEWATRDAAEHFLLRQAPERRSDVETAFLQTHDPEVGVRLRRVALHLYLKAHTPLRGAGSLLGIALAVEPVRRAARHAEGEETLMSVAVQELQPGFPAAEALQVGDRIIGLNGEEFGPDLSIDAFRARINATGAGQRVELRLIRAGTELRVGVLLAGVPETGVVAISEYMQERTARAETYLRGLDAAERRERGGVVVGGGEEAASWVPPLKDPGRGW